MSCGCLMRLKSARLSVSCAIPAAAYELRALATARVQLACRECVLTAARPFCFESERLAVAVLHDACRVATASMLGCCMTHVAPLPAYDWGRALPCVCCPHTRRLRGGNKDKAPATLWTHRQRPWNFSRLAGRESLVSCLSLRCGWRITPLSFTSLQSSAVVCGFTARLL